MTENATLRSQCALCPTGSSVPYRGSTTIDACKCSIGQYGTGGSQLCQPCPLGGVCTTWNTFLPGVQPGYWRAPGTTEFFQCNPLESCLGDQWANGTMIGEAVCAPGYTGVACGEC